MNKVVVYFERFTRYLTEGYRQKEAATWFLKAMFLVALFRLSRFWLAADVFFYESVSSFPRSLVGKIVLWPAMLAQDNPEYFFITGLAVSVAGLVVRPNIIVNGLFFWIILSFFKLRFPATNGADYVLLTFSGLAIPLGRWPEIGSETVNILRATLHNTFRLLIRIQLLTIYLISGWDKITTPMWRSGEAFEYIAHLDVMFNPVFTPLFEYRSAQVVMAWATILFELSFIPLVLIERTRIAILLTGVVFHTVIWLMLGLPDFAWTMIAAYPIFLRNADLVFIRTRWNRLRNSPMR